MQYLIEASLLVDLEERGITGGTNLAVVSKIYQVTIILPFSPWTNAHRRTLHGIDSDPQADIQT
jgi:hypothetical protein